MFVPALDPLGFHKTGPWGMHSALQITKHIPVRFIRLFILTLTTYSYLPRAARMSALEVEW